MRAIYYCIQRNIGKRFIKELHPLLLILSFVSLYNSFNVRVMIKDLNYIDFPLKYGVSI